MSSEKRPAKTQSFTPEAVRELTSAGVQRRLMKTKTRAKAKAA